MLIRHKVLAKLQEEGAIDDAVIESLLSWHHSGFGIHVGLEIAATDAMGRENVARLNLHPNSSPGDPMRSILCLAALTAGLLLLPRESRAEESKRDKATKLGWSAEKKLKDGDLDGALAEYEECIKLDPDSASHWAGRGEVWFAKKDHDKAIADYTRSIERYLVDAGGRKATTGTFLAMAYLARRAECKVAKGDLDGALSDHTQAVELDPSNVVPLIQRAEFKLRLNDNDGAMADFNKAVAAKPEGAGCWKARGKARYGLRDYDGAIADFTRAIECNRAAVKKSNEGKKDGDWKEKEDIDMYYQRAAVHLDKRDYEGAIADYTEVIKVNSRHAYTWHNRGVARRGAKDLDGAIADFTQAIDLNPKDAEHWLGRGVTKFQKGDYEGTMEDCGKATQLDPGSYNAWCYIGNAGFGARAYQKAVEAYSKALELQPLVANLWQNRGRAKCLLLDFPGANADFTRAIEIAPGDVNSRMFRAKAHAMSGNADGALADFARTIELDPQGWRYREVGWYQYRLGKFAEAQTSLRRACEVDAKDQDYVRTLLFLICVRLGDRERAGKELSGYLDGRTAGESDDWYLKVSSYLLGKLPEAEFLKAAESGDEGEIQNQKCEAFFYVGTLKLIEGMKDEAKQLFQKCVETGRTDLVEFDAAQAELKALDKK